MSYPNLRAEMARENITQKSLASKLEVTERTVNSWLNGDGNPKVDQCFYIRDNFFPSMTVDYLFSRKPA